MAITSFQDNQLKGLYYLSVGELKTVCMSLGLSKKGGKGDLIVRVIAFLKKGEKVETVPFPENSCFQPNVSYPLLPLTPILFGNYKNDLRTRRFLKSMIGPHFHFTASGQDWIKARWREGNPPTYAEFATFWKADFNKKQEGISELKPEWAYLTFVRDYIAAHPDAPKIEITNAWEKTRAAEAKKIFELLEISENLPL